MMLHVNYISINRKNLIRHDSLYFLKKYIFNIFDDVFLFTLYVFLFLHRVVPYFEKTDLKIGVYTWKKY